MLLLPSNTYLLCKMKITNIAAMFLGTIIFTFGKKKFADGKYKNSIGGVEKGNRGSGKMHLSIMQNYLMYFCEWKMCESTKIRKPKELYKCKRFRRCRRKHLKAYYCQKLPKPCEESFPAKDFKSVCKYCFTNNILTVHNLGKIKEFPLRKNSTKSEQCHKVQSCLRSSNGYKNRMEKSDKMIKAICAKRIIHKHNLHRKCHPTQILRQINPNEPERLEYVTPMQNSASQPWDSKFLRDTTSPIIISSSQKPFSETVVNLSETNFEETPEDKTYSVNKKWLIVIGSMVGIPLLVFMVVVYMVRKRKQSLKGLCNKECSINNDTVDCDIAGISVTLEHYKVNDLSETASCSYFSEVTNQVLVGNEIKCFNNIDVLSKNLEIDACNDYDMLAKSKGTQTKIANIPKSIYDQPWQTSSSMTHLGGILQTPESAVSLVVPSGTVVNELFIYGSVHVDLQMLTKTLGLEEDYICSPAPEYHMDGNWKLLIKKHMIIHLPYVMPCENDTDLPIVYTFYLDSGKIIKSPVSLKTKINQAEDLPNTFYEIDDKKKMIYIYTRHFCGFIACCGCKDLVRCPGTLDARIFGKSKMTSGRREVRIRYVIWDHKSSIPDFQKKYLMDRDDFKLLESPCIELSEKMTENTLLTFTMKVINDESNEWQCLRDGEETLFPLKISVELKKLFSCCRTRPYYIDWVVTRPSSGYKKNDFGCVLSITDDSLVDEDGQVNKQPCYIDNVPDISIPEKREPSNTDIQHIDILKKKLAPSQVQVISRELPFARCHEIDEDLRGNMDKDDFMDKWVKKLWSFEEFRRKMNYFLKKANAYSAIEELEKVPKNSLFKRSLESIGSSISSESRVYAIAEPLASYLRSHSPCENSDYEIEFRHNDQDQTYLKCLETEI